MGNTTRSYALHRPIGPFTWPSEHHEKVAEIVNWDTVQYVPEINRSAYGYIDWTELPPIEDLNRYELMVPSDSDQFLEKIGRILANLYQNEQYDRPEKAWTKAESQYGYTGDQIGAAMSRYID